MSVYKTRRTLCLLAAMLLTAASLISAVPVSAAEQSAAYDDLMLIPGGMTFGVQLKTKGVLVIGIGEPIRGSDSSPAQEAGLEISDVIYEINGEEVNTVDEVINLIETCDGTKLELSVLRGGNRMKLTLEPIYSPSDGVYKAGMLIRDSSAGIGTVTFIEPGSGIFGGLGHGICDVDTGALMPLLKGSVSGVTVSSVKKGKAGAPGELRGYFNSEQKGSLLSNTETGVYGKFSDMPDELEKPLPVADISEVVPGEAYIYCTAENNNVKKYRIDIVRITDKKKNGKNFVIELCDDSLIEKTGGIVQGMSGSPIIQNGKIVGAVTHVMINDPLRGYGIFIENMLGNIPVNQ